MDDGSQIDAVYTDLKAAFDRVDHNILLTRLSKLGISPDLICWFDSYLKDRKLCVKIGSNTSEFFTNTSGVPQGSNLGPLLFSLFINDLAMLLPSGCRLFYADDVKIYIVINCIEDCFMLQRCVDLFVEWCTRNKLTLSVQKCSVISFHRKLKPVIFDYTILDRSLERVDHVRDLGVNLDSALTFRLHYSDIISKANRQLGFIFKIAKEFRDPHCLRSLYCALVRSILESNAVVWCPYQANWIARIEAIQRRFVRQALRSLPWRDPRNLPPYEDRCRLLGLETLENRRCIAQAMFIAKVLLGDIDAPHIMAQLNIYAPERILRQRGFFFLGPRHTEYGLNDPIRSMSSRFNEVYMLFDFNLSAASFHRRLQTR